jgi:hypothetical protein
MKPARGFAISSTKAEQYSTQDVAKAVPWIARLDHQVEVGVQTLDVLRGKCQTLLEPGGWFMLAMLNAGVRGTVSLNVPTWRGAGCR